MKTLGELINGSALSCTNWRDVPVGGVSCDSRRVRPGEVYVAVQGAQADGHAFIPQALAAGAAAVVAQKAVYPLPSVPVVIVRDARKAYARIAARLHDEPSRRLNVIGVTGTNGKTTTTFVLRSILQAAGERAGLLGTVFNILGDKPVDSSMTTPDAATVQASMAEMVRRGCRSCVIEVSSHALVQNRVDEVHFAAGIFTNLTRDHLDYHQTLEQYRNAKALLFEQLPPRGVAAINADDPHGEFFSSRGAARLVTWGLERGEVRGRIEELSIHGTRFSIELGGETLTVHSPLIGRHNVQNMLGAAACLYAMGYDLDPIKAGLESARTVPGRLEEISLSQDYKVFVDYAHTPDALERVVGTLKPITPGRVIVVFGCGGDRDRGKRPLMGEAVERTADVAVVTSDNPRSEEPMAIVQDILKGLKRPAQAEVVVDRREAIHRAVRLARTGDTILIAGKGHEAYQVVKGKIFPFDDRTVAYEAIKARIMAPM
jgi:UDP-N-acetylmuramoyl-L-alanyl-D-glutamate--2,6-diaminopimelate ligase